MPATAGQESLLEEIWLAGFPEDSPETVRGFLRAFPADRHAIVCCEDGCPVSMAFLLPAVWRLNAETLPVQYLYAAATLPAFRGRGLFGELLGFAHNRAKSAGLAATFLRPGEPALFDYYSRFGYHPCFGVTTIEQRLCPDAEPMLPVRQLSSSAYAVIRRRYLQSYASWIDWPDAVLNYAISFSEGVFAVGDAAALCETACGRLTVRELFCLPEERDMVLQSLASYFACRSVSAWIPAEDAAVIQPVGMLCPHRSLEPEGVSYMGLTLE